MKRLKKLFAALVLCAPLTAAAQDIEINAENFPDENFRAYLLGQDYGEDGVLTEEEIKKVTSIYVNSKSISSLKGIEYFTALTSLSCSTCRLTALDVSKNTALTEFNCSWNQITALDVSKNTALAELWCQCNQLTVLDVSNNTELYSLDCQQNQLTTLDVSNNTALTRLNCSLNQITALDVSKNTTLTELWCDGNQLTALDVSKNTALKELRCYANQIKGKSMDALVSSLPETTSGSLYVSSGSQYHNEGNIMTKSQVAAAKAKGWTPYYSYSVDNYLKWAEYEGMDDNAPASITLPELETDTATIHTLHGQKVTTPQKGGIYIVGGKKIVVK